MTRRVVAIHGPPGSGKTTLARQLSQSDGLELYDMDDAQWLTATAFTRALARIGRDPNARAVVIRAGATISARTELAALIGTTETIIVDTPADVCIQRVKSRRRLKTPLSRQIAGVGAWWIMYEPPARSRKWGAP